MSIHASRAPRRARVGLAALAAAVALLAASAAPASAGYEVCDTTPSGAKVNCRYQPSMEELPENTNRDLDVSTSY